MADIQMREAYDARLAEAAANAGRWANATPEDHAGNRERLAEAQAKGERRIRELNEMQAYYSRKWPWAEIITASLWIILFVFLLPYEFRDNAWPWLTVKILGSVLTSAILPATFLVPIYLVLKSQ